jgi:hypothetical protein
VGREVDGKRIGCHAHDIASTKRSHLICRSAGQILCTLLGYAASLLFSRCEAQARRIPANLHSDHDTPVMATCPIFALSISFPYAVSAGSRFALLVQDVSVSNRACALATNALVDALAETGAVDDGDRDAAASAAEWVNNLLNSKTFFTNHPDLILQVFFHWPSLFLPLICIFTAFPRLCVYARCCSP